MGRMLRRMRMGTSSLGRRITPAPEMTAKAGVPQGTVYEFTMSSEESKLYPGIAREPHTFGTPIRTIPPG